MHFSGIMWKPSTTMAESNIRFGQYVMQADSMLVQILPYGGESSECKMIIH